MEGDESPEISAEDLPVDGDMPATDDLIEEDPGEGQAADAAVEPEGISFEELDESGVPDANNLAELGEADPEARTAADLEPIFDIPVNVSAILGKAHLQVSDLLKLSSGAVIELDRKVGESVDIYVNNRLVARGEVVVVESQLGVTMTEIIKQAKA